MIRSAGKTISVSCVSATNRLKAVAKSLAVSCASATTLTAGKAYIKAIAAGCISTASLTRNVGKSLAASCTSAVSVLRSYWATALKQIERWSEVGISELLLRDSVSEVRFRDTLGSPLLAHQGTYVGPSGTWAQAARQAEIWTAAEISGELLLRDNLSDLILRDGKSSIALKYPTTVRTPDKWLTLAGITNKWQTLQ